MRILALSFFDPASVILSHRDLMRAAGHDFRLAVVRAYTERQRQADYVLEEMVEGRDPAGRRSFLLVRLSPNMEELREFAASADVIQFHPGIGRGDGDWASRSDSPLFTYGAEQAEVFSHFGLVYGMEMHKKAEVAFFHGSRNTWTHRAWYEDLVHSSSYGRRMFAGVASSTIDYAAELDAAYLPPLVDVGDLRAPLRGDDDPLLIAHTPTDRVACSTAEFLKAARDTGVPVRLGEGLSHKECLALKAECNAGFDHLRGAFSVNTLENAALGLAPLFALNPKYRDRAQREGFDPLSLTGYWIQDAQDLSSALRLQAENAAMTRAHQIDARRWWETYFSAESITKRLIKFYEGL